MFRKLRLRLRLLRQGLYSKPLKEATYQAQVGDRQLELCHSRFNPKWLRELGITPTTIVDLGSFDGGDAVRFSTFFPSSRVVTVEADPERFPLVQNNLSGSQIEVEHIAVCEQDGPIAWYSSTIDGEVNAQGSIYAHTEDYRQTFSFVKQVDKPQTVEGTRLDSLCKRLAITHVDLLHMDIEGAEYSVLRGMGAIRPQTIFLETFDNRFVGGATVADTDRLLMELGYCLVLDLGTDRLYRHKPTQVDS